MDKYEFKFATIFEKRRVESVEICEEWERVNQSHERREMRQECEKEREGPGEKREKGKGLAKLV